LKFNIVPENYIADADKYIADEKEIILGDGAI
jgi:hypothetical protein